MRNIKLQFGEEKKISNNETIMDLACKFVKEKRNPKKWHQQINQVRLKNKLHLPVELVGPKGRIRTESFVHLNRESPLKWWFMSENIDKPTREECKAWNEFVKWMITQKITFANDIEQHNTWKWRISECGVYVRHNPDEGENEHCRRNVTSLEIFEKCEQVQVKWEKGVTCDEIGKTRKKIRVTCLNVSNDESKSEEAEICDI